VPSSVGLAILGPSMIGAIYEGGSFNAYDTEQTALALSAFAVGLAGYSAVKVLTPAFYALGDSRTPMIVSALNIAVNYLTAWFLLRRLGLGHEALAYTTSAVALFGALTLFWMIRRKLSGIEGRAMISSLSRMSVAAVGMGMVVWLISHRLHESLGDSRGVRLADLALSIPIGAIAFYFACRWMRVPELELAANAIGGPLRRLSAFRRARIG
jgi:putative peptidoglycan lipid II flippase